MIVYKTRSALKKALQKTKKNRLSIGFVPTMGALHDGHLSLVKKAKSENDICLCSVFVNPTQFNNRRDFELYPISLEADIDMLFSAGADWVFIPSVQEMYPPGISLRHYNLGYLEDILEGKFRPGHYQGVCNIVDTFLRLIQPHTLYLGQKDYQQCMVIKKLIELKKFKTDLQICPTIREWSGLAMSSRNRRLAASEKRTATAISRMLFDLQKKIKPSDLSPLSLWGKTLLEKKGFTVDYVHIADATNLREISVWDGQTPLVALVAGGIHEVRLIDNLILFEGV